MPEEIPNLLRNNRLLVYRTPICEKKGESVRISNGRRDISIELKCFPGVSQFLYNINVNKCVFLMNDKRKKMHLITRMGSFNN